MTSAEQRSEVSRVDLCPRLLDPLPPVLSLWIPDVASAAIMLALNGIMAISSGSACTSQSYEPSHVLAALGVEEHRIDGALLVWPTMPADTEEQRKLRELFAKPARDRRIPPVEVGRILSGWIETEPVADVATQLGLRDVGTVRQLVRLLSLPSDLHALVGWGRREGTVSFSVAMEVARAGSADEQRTLFQSALEQGLSKQDLQRLFRQASTGNVSVAEVLNASGD